MKGRVKLFAIAGKSGKVAVATETSAKVHPSPSRLVMDLRDCVIVAMGSDLMAEFAVAAANFASLSGNPEPSIGVRSGAAPGEGAGVATVTTHRRLFIIDASLSISSKVLSCLPKHIKEPLESEHSGDWTLKERAVALAKAYSEWSLHVSHLGLTPKLTGGSAAATIIPRRFRRGNLHNIKTKKDALDDISETKFGGRVQCFAPGFSGPSVEYDMRTAYGASVSGIFGHVPDSKVYVGKKPLPSQPYVARATVQVQGPFSTLPVRDRDYTWRVHWPDSGIMQGWYCGADLERSGVKVLAIHEYHSGRYSDELSDAAAALLEREISGDQLSKAVTRQCVVSLAGKLAQRSREWAIVHPHKYEGAERMFEIRSRIGSVYLVPSGYVRSSTYCPMAYSYVTSYVRNHLQDTLRANPQAVYCDTDSIHIPEYAKHDIQTGNDPGDWTEKERGVARYYGVRNYRIGKKIVGFGPRDN